MCTAVSLTFCVFKVAETLDAIAKWKTFGLRDSVLPTGLARARSLAKASMF